MTHDRIRAVPIPALEQPVDLLESWKDIATYLRRDVSTVQRWEKRERMPVHRHLHDKLGSVYAFRSELDTWWRGRGNGLTGDETSNGAEQSAPGPLVEQAAGIGEPATPTGRPGSWRSVVLVGVGVLAVSAAVGLFWHFGWPGGRAGRVNPEAADLLLRARYSASARPTRTTNA